jgi:hypothetical protein
MRFKVAQNSPVETNLDCFAFHPNAIWIVASDLPKRETSSPTATGRATFDRRARNLPLNHHHALRARICYQNLTTAARCTDRPIKKLWSDALQPHAPR